MKTQSFIVACLVVALGTVSGCTKKQDDGNLMVYYGSHGDDVKTWDPANAYDTVSLDVLPSIYEQLYQYAYLEESYKVVPLLAADMPKYSHDRLTMTIPLKHGIKFQDDPCFKDTGGKGRELKAQDFIYAWKRMALPAIQSQGWWIFDGKIKGINAFHDKMAKASKAEIPKIFAEDFEGFQALDDYTIQIKFTQPYPQFMYILTMGFASPVAKEAVAAYADEAGNLTNNPVGTGPFVLKSWNRGSQIVMERNPNFHPDFYPTEGSQEYRRRGLLADAGKPLPFLDRVVINVIKESQPRWLAFLKGNQDRITIPKDNFTTVIANRSNLSPEVAAKGIRLHIEAGTVFYYISFNMKDKLVGANKYLRQALSASIDREKWIDTFTNGTGKKQTTALPPGVLDRPNDQKLKYDFDLKHAKELLKKAGYPDAKGLPPINFDLRGADTVSRQMGEFFSDQWKQIGVKVNVITNTFPAYLEKAKQGNLQVSLGGWNLDYPDGENVYQLLYGPNQAPGPNESNFDHPEMNALYKKMAVAESGAARAATVKKMDDILQEEIPWALGYYYAHYELSQPWLLNYRSNDIINNRYKYYRINKDVKKRYLSGN